LLVKKQEINTMPTPLKDWSDERLQSQLECTRKFKPYKHEVKRHQELLAELEAELARRQAARSVEDSGTGSRDQPQRTDA